jgi:hypothetical protein
MRRAIVLALSAAIALLGALTPVYASGGSGIGPGYQLSLSIVGNCIPSKNNLVEPRGTVNLNPYRVWQTEYKGSGFVGPIAEVFVQQDGFSTALKYSGCDRSQHWGDIVVILYGYHKVVRSGIWWYRCYPIGTWGNCAPVFPYQTYRGWVSRNW